MGWKCLSVSELKASHSSVNEITFILYNNLNICKRQIYVIYLFSGVLEKPLEKKAGRNFGPPGSKKLIYFVDDMNMPMVKFYQFLNSQKSLFNIIVSKAHWNIFCWTSSFG